MEWVRQTTQGKNIVCIQDKCGGKSVEKYTHSFLRTTINIPVEWILDYTFVTMLIYDCIACFSKNIKIESHTFIVRTSESNHTLL